MERNRTTDNGNVLVDPGFVSPIYDFGEDERRKKNGLSRTRSSSIHADPHQIEISLEEGAGDPTDEVLDRAAGFFVEHNENYEISWADASHMISDAETDPSKPPVPGLNKEYLTWRLRRTIESIFFRLFTLLLILVDIVIVIVDLSIEGSQPGLQIVDLVISIYFVIEVSLRLIALKPHAFFIHWYNVLDLVVILVTFIISVIALSGTNWAEGLSLFTALRFVRIVRFVRIYTEKKNIETAARQLISQNKRRYQQDGFDLDLTYVTNRVIATSFPSSGLWAAYRNPIEKVAQFLDTKHKDHYKVFNLCSEKTYNTSFFHDRVERVLIDDHNVPSVAQLLEFADTVRTWLGEHPDNVIVVHCKGGKGRTGTMICVWLIESGVFTSASLSLDYFGHRRTDTNVSKKFQGVETPSQSRYVGYYEIVKNNGRILPESVPVRLTEIIITGMMYIGNGTGSDFWVEIDQGRGNTVLTAVFGTQKNCTMEYNSVKDTLRIKVLNCPVLKGDTRVLFQTNSTNVPKYYEKCPFYFWFHTGFLENGELLLKREDLDNPHKSKTWDIYRENFSVKLLFA
ncbi:phosphatidylinositol 3,4,5-trisphosphate 3-phosphatase TPTE2 [Eurytemora carolleeae]|uniref:phosphatidylinositol 3,4,5-trisphosphate 3-phosphatase TPTE2 n=1 Tax=Eurytemora carolleeae TaxID=1294199 RepID=UPI000C7605AC|nr:phosphatidylinositol 3,4,5-trisphosphate 3-phosphatase TPTE2 [Eurytemora carolleeae]|eukprot:XP_023320715.1 phosphatidylinositol 3,4,5-trisphosphate 3-phosphatase TPTE2-like [Eurytemora affinis]